MSERQVNAEAAPPALHFRADGTFTIVQFTDLHVKNGEPQDEETVALMAAILEAEQPDLAVLSGDVVDGKGSRDTRPRRGVSPWIPLRRAACPGRRSSATMTTRATSAAPS